MFSADTLQFAARLLDVREQFARSTRRILAECAGDTALCCARLSGDLLDTLDAANQLPGLPATAREAAVSAAAERLRGMAAAVEAGEHAAVECVYGGLLAGLTATLKAIRAAASA